MKISISLDIVGYSKKPKEKETIIEISNRIAGYPVNMEMKEIVDKVGNAGYTFCPAVFLGNRRIKENVQEMQLFVLDFDSGISYEEIEKRAEEWKIPIIFSYKTFSWTPEHERFRVAFLHNTAVKDKRAIEIIIALLMGIFPECDLNCKDACRVFFGGIGLLKYDENAVFNFKKLIRAYECYQHRQRKDYSDVIKGFAKRFHIRLKNGLLDVAEEGTPGKVTKSNIIYIENATFPGYYLYLEDSFGGAPNIKAGIGKKRLVHCLEIEEKCRIYREFLFGNKRLSHNERFFLALNLTHIKGGEKTFRNVIKRDYPEQYEKWEDDLWYIKKREYQPGNCDTFCPYKEECCHDTNIILTCRMKNRIEKADGVGEIYYTLEEASAHLMDTITKALLSPTQGIHLIEAQTGLGKTRGYCRILAGLREQKDVIVAVYSNELKHQVYQWLKDYGLTVRYTPSLDEMPLMPDIRNKIQWLYSVGLHENIKGALRRYIRENKKTLDSEVLLSVQACKEYCDFDWLKPGHIVTTHQRLLNIPEDALEGKEVIIDEDILYTMFMNVYTISRDTIKMVRENSGDSYELWIRTGELLEKKEGEYGCLEKVGERRVNEKDILKLGINENIGAMLQAESFCVEGEEVTLFCPQKLRKGKYIILSATVNEILYKKYFYEMPIITYEKKQAQYKGKVIQYTHYSLSRTSLVDKAEDVFAFVRSLEKDIPIITFKSYGKKNNFNLHFGNTQGIDSLAGKNLAIVGTPHSRLQTYNLISVYLDGVIDIDPIKQKIERNGYRFLFMTFKKKIVREIQLYFIESELEQCIGRARLLRNNATVYIFSNYPCRQAVFEYKKYLN